MKQLAKARNTQNRTGLPEMLDTCLVSVLNGLQEIAPEHDQDVRVYSAMGCVRSLLQTLSHSSRLTVAQQEQLLLIAKTWHESVFGKEEEA